MKEITNMLISLLLTKNFPADKVSYYWQKALLLTSSFFVNTYISIAMNEEVTKMAKNVPSDKVFHCWQRASLVKSNLFVNTDPHCCEWQRRQKCKDLCCWQRISLLTKSFFADIKLLCESRSTLPWMKEMTQTDNLLSYTGRKEISLCIEDRGLGETAPNLSQHGNNMVQCRKGWLNRKMK